MSYIIINDLRALPVAAAISIRSKLQRKNTTIMISREIMRNHDYGQLDSERLANIKAHLLKIFFGAIIVESDSEIEDASDTTGLMSSLYSITNDSLASKEKYPDLWRELLALNRGACSIVKELIKCKAQEVYVFNGRLAYCYAITKYAANSNLKCFFYEYGRQVKINRWKPKYTLTSFPIHRLERWGQELLNFYKFHKFLPAQIEILGDDFKRSKLTNKFTEFYEDGVSSKYDVVVFLSSTHEFLSLSEEICGNALTNGELEFLKKVIAANGENLKYAVRCHPNQTNDPSWQDSLKLLKNYCSFHRIDFFPPTSKISSYQLIENSKKVAVDISSIGIDAIIMKKSLEIFGNPDYRKIFDAAKEQFPNDSFALSKYVCEAMALQVYLFQYKLSSIGLLWYLLDRVLFSRILRMK